MTKHTLGKLNIIWGVPRPTFGRMRHAFVKGKSLCGKFINELDPQQDKGLCVCATCQKIAKAKGE